MHDLLWPSEGDVDWATVIEYAESHPPWDVKCEYIGNAMNWGCPIDLLKRMILVNPEALHGCVYGGGYRYDKFNPLGLACKLGLPLDIIQLIVQEIVTPMKEGKRRRQEKDVLRYCLWTTGIDKHSFPLYALKIFLEEFPLDLFMELREHSQFANRCGYLAARIVMNSSNDEDCWEKIKPCAEVYCIDTLRLSFWTTQNEPREVSRSPYVHCHD